MKPADALGRQGTFTPEYTARLAAGGYSVTISVDSGRTVDESNEDNNSVTLEFTVN